MESRRRLDLSEDGKNLLEWFGKRKENVLQSGIGTHALAVLDCVLELNICLRSMENGETSSAEKSIERLFVNEKKADSIEDQLCEQLSIGDLNIQEREDLLHFVRKIDNIANWAKEAALHVRLINEIGLVIPKDIWNNLAGIGSELETEVKYLMNAIKLLGTDGPEIHNCVQGVKDQESIIDRLNHSAERVAYTTNMDYKSLMLVSEVLNSLEMAADTGKSCADTISILTVARRL